MCTSGALIGTRKTITPQRRTGILEGRKTDCAAFRAAVLGVIRSKRLAQLTEAACRRIMRIRTMDFDCAAVAKILGFEPQRPKNTEKNRSKNSLMGLSSVSLGLCGSRPEANLPDGPDNLDALEQYRQSGCAHVGSDSGRHRDSRDRIRVCIECAVHRRRCRAPFQSDHRGLS